MKYIIDQHSLDAAMIAFLVAVALWLKYAPTRAEMWRWLEFQSQINAEANEMKERRRAERAAAMKPAEVERG
jgi:hypothetical protein